jgi:hypothetical protein
MTLIQRKDFKNSIETFEDLLIDNIKDREIYDVDNTFIITFPSSLFMVNGVEIFCDNIKIIKKHFNEDYIMFYKHNDMLVEVSFFNLREIKTYGDE